MKKRLILGLLALSVVAMAESTTTTINVNTKLNINDSGIIITPTPDGTTTANSIDLDHGTPDKGLDSVATGKSVYIKTADGQLPAGIKLNVSLDSSKVDGNNLVTGAKSEAETIPHQLDGIIKNGALTGTGKLSVVGATTNAAQTLTTTGEALEVAFTSTVAKNNLIGKFSGDYTNTSTLSVTVLAN